MRRFITPNETTLRSALGSASAPVQNAALLLLDQPPRKALEFASLEPALSSANETLRTTAIHILQRHPEWAAHASALIERLISAPEINDAETERLRSLIISFHAQKQVQDLIEASLANAKVPPARRITLTEILGRLGIGEIPKPWSESLGRNLSSPNPALRGAAVKAVATLQLQRVDDELVRIGNDPKEAAEVRLAALRGVASRALLTSSSFDFISTQLAGHINPLTRLAAADVFRNSKATQAMQAALRATVGDDPLIAPLLSFQDKTTEEQRALLAKYEPVLNGGDPARGVALFAGKGICATCHQVGRDGGRIGPDLTRIGAIRSRRDLLESIVLPSSTFAQGYEPYQVTTKEGIALAGMIARETADGILLRDLSGTEQRVARHRIEKMERVPASLMPAGLDRVLTIDEFRDLLAYLESLR